MLFKYLLNVAAHSPGLCPSSQDTSHHSFQPSFLFYLCVCIGRGVCVLALVRACAHTHYWWTPWLRQFFRLWQSGTEPQIMIAAWEWSSTAECLPDVSRVLCFTPELQSNLKSGNFVLKLYSLMKGLRGKFYILNSDKTFGGSGECLKQQQNVSRNFSDIRT